ncbi:aldehyde dehydrogenase family protein [Pseudomonas paeninsulae]
MGEAILNPANGEVLARIAKASSKPVEAAILAAHRAFPRGSRTTAQQRSLILLGIAAAIEQHADLLARPPASGGRRRAHLWLLQRWPGLHCGLPHLCSNKYP